MEDKKIGIEDIFPKWESLTQSQQAQVKVAAKEWHFKKGQIVHRGGDCDGLIIVREGQLRVFMLSESGKEITLYRLFDWDLCLFSAACAFKNVDFELSVEAETDTIAFILQSGIYAALIKQAPAVAAFTGEIMAQRMSDVMFIMEKALFTGFDSRLASFLLEQTEITGSDTIEITHDEIARNLGSAREVVTKMLKSFVQNGSIVLSRGKITVADKHKLNTIAESKDR